MKYNKKDFSFLYSTNGYRLTFKKKEIGGAGTKDGSSKIDWRIKRKNAEMYREMAQRDLDKILAGHGDERYLEVINKLQLHS